MGSNLTYVEPLAYLNGKPIGAGVKPAEGQQTATIIFLHGKC